MKILFQGDSITDAGRDRKSDTSMGTGYPYFISGEFNYKYPNEYEFCNKGISGNRIVDLYARIKSDIINLAPDVMSILIGVNDVWHEVDYKNGVDAEKFYKIYAMLIEEVKAALPDIRIMILEPFALMGTGNENAWEYFSDEVKKRAKVAKRIADEYGLKFVPLQDGFDKLCEKASADYWLRDGVHPTSAGHNYIKEAWVNAFSEL